MRRVYCIDPSGTSLAKVADHVHALYRPCIEAAPFAVLATRPALSKSSLHAPGVSDELRVNGSARISALPALCEALAVDGKAPANVLVIHVRSVYFQCARAIKRSGLWNPAQHIAAGTLPSPGAILEYLSAQRLDGAAYDAALQARQASTRC